MGQIIIQLLEHYRKVCEILNGFEQINLSFQHFTISKDTYNVVIFEICYKVGDKKHSTKGRAVINRSVEYAISRAFEIAYRKYITMIVLAQDTDNEENNNTTE